MSLSLCLLRATIIQPPWPSGRGQEIGSLHGYLWEVCNSLSRPFFYDDKVASTFILDRALGLAVIGVELSYLPEGLSDKAIIAHFEEHRLFFAVYVNAGEDPGPYSDYIESCCDEQLQLDWSFK